MPVNFPEELTHLAMVQDKLHDALAKLNKRVTGYEQEYTQIKRYLAANWNELDTMEKFSNERSTTQIEHAGNLTLERRTKIEKLLNTPYFARIDFQYDGEDDAEPIYIGQFSFTDNDNQVLVYDWRAPISGMYYDYEVGRASYEAPVGTIEGDIVRKRQFKIKSGRMEYVLESAINIDDDILQRELSSTSDEKMKSIIATIQKEQNQIIRNDKADVLIIQGVAGSGKTSIALHRIAYMLYRYKERLSADNVVVISPNKVFADYISNVLPELGEEPIWEISFDDIAAKELSGVLTYERFADRIEDSSPEWLKRSRFKADPAFTLLADDYLHYAAAAFFEPKDYSFGTLTIPKDYIQGRYHAYQNRPIFKRFTEIADDILEQIKADTERDQKLPGRNEIIKKLTAMFKPKNTMALYTGFYDYIKKPDMFVPAEKNKLEWPDVFPYIYFKIFVEGIDGFSDIQHLVIDEMQDYTPIQYAVIKQLFPCQKTILGDFGQSISPYNSYSLDTLKAIFDHPCFVELTKSYRSTYEIIEFAKTIQPQLIEPVERHGEKPELIRCDNSLDELSVIKEKVAGFTGTHYSTLGILCKHTQQAKRLCEELAKDYPVTLLDADSTEFTQGITITTIFMSKGLEFDEVLIPYANEQTYSSEQDRSLLYVACTRAMHKLTLSYCGRLTRFLDIRH